MNAVPRALGPVERARRRPRTYGDARRLLLAERGVSLAAIARTLGLALPTVSRVNDGQRRSRRVADAIAAQLGLPLADAFPDIAYESARGERR